MPYLFPTESTVGAFLFLTVPLLLVIYLGFLLVIRPPKKVLFASLLGGIIVGLVNLLVDIAAYYAHWWHYTLKELVLHVPVPFYISPALIFGSLTYLLIWRFLRGRSRWFALLLLIGVPLFCIARDVSGGLTHTAYQEWENGPVATLVTIVMWIVAFYAGFGLFWRITAHIDPEVVQDESGEPTARQD
ncbi:MAG TPA: hypothetical protein VHV10_18150 [Ktedonobacteraceae bacterium]|jgi:uncharacterized membrane protein|nr:hypothetical protein [Ktedonobacteraceae bacterium]